MGNLKKAKQPFVFCARLHLTELTGLKASTVEQLLRLIKKVPGSCVYHHTHRFLQQHLFFSPEPPNDFAYWVANILGEDELGEVLASIDTVQFTTIRALREKLIEVIQKYLRSHPSSKLKFADEGNEFHFMKSVSFILPNGSTATDLKEFAEALKKLTPESLYYHVFEARLRLGRGGNDFSHWIEDSLGDKSLAQKIVRLDPYTQTLDSLKGRLVRIIESEMGRSV